MAYDLLQELQKQKQAPMMTPIPPQEDGQIFTPVVSMLGTAPEPTVFDNPQKLNQVVAQRAPQVVPGAPAVNRPAPLPIDQVIQSYGQQKQGLADLQNQLNQFKQEKSGADPIILSLMAAQDILSGTSNLPATIMQQKQAEEARKLKLFGLDASLQGQRAQLTREEADYLKSQEKNAKDEKLKELSLESLKTGIDEKKAAKQVQLESRLNEDWLKNPITKDTQNVATAYEKVNVAASEPSAAGDLSLIFGYMKMLDPGSTVREGEFANAQNAAGVPDQVRNMYEKVRTGQRLNPSQRADFLKQAENVYKGQLAQQTRFDDTIRSRAKKVGADPESVVFSNTLFGNVGKKQVEDPAMKRLEELRAKKAGK